MEIASLQASEPWSDRPRTTDRTLGMIARLVNDAVSASARAQLAPLIPATLGTNTADARLPTALALATADVASAYGAVTPTLLAPPPAPGTVDPPDRPSGWLARARRARRLRRARRQAETIVAAAAAELTRLPTPEADAALTELLIAAITTTRQHTHPHHGLAVAGPAAAAAHPRGRPTMAMPGQWIAASDLHAHDLIHLNGAPVVELTAVSTGQVVQLTGWTHDANRRDVTATYQPGEPIWRIYCPALSG